MNVLIVSANTAAYPDPVYPLGAACVADACARAGHEVTTFDCAFAEQLSGELTATIDATQPDIIGISLRNADDVSYPNSVSFLPHYRTLIAAIKRASTAPIVLGGPAVSIFPHEYAEQLQPHCCVVGDGETAMVELIERHARGLPLPPIFRAARVALDTLPIIERKLFDVSRYYDQGGVGNIQTKRGCGFQCSFCTFPYLEGTQIRARTPGVIVDEMELLQHRHGVKHIFFVDSVFNAPTSHARTICEELLNRRLRLRWTCYLRPVLDDPDLPALMKRAGCMAVELGTEALAEPTMASLNKQQSIDEVFAFCAAFRAANIPFCHGLMFGAPGETWETVKETVANIEATEPTAAIANIGIRLYPHTGLAKSLAASGFLSDESACGLEPLFYVSPAIADGLTEYLGTLSQSHRAWIVPGLNTSEREFVSQMRGRRRRGPSWLFKQYEAFITHQKK